MESSFTAISTVSLTPTFAFFALVFFCLFFLLVLFLAFVVISILITLKGCVELDGIPWLPFLARWIVCLKFIGLNRS